MKKTITDYYLLVLKAQRRLKCWYTLMASSFTVLARCCPSICEYQKTHPLACSGQVYFQLTLPGGEAEILQKY